MVDTVLFSIAWEVAAGAGLFSIHRLGECLQYEMVVAEDKRMQRVKNWP